MKSTIQIQAEANHFVDFDRVARQDGPFSPRRYSPGTHVIAVQTISRHTALHTAHAPRINPVVVARFRPGKVLGEGGQVMFSLARVRSVMDFCT